jgi:hypothetical protein
MSVKTKLINFFTLLVLLLTLLVQADSTANAQQGYQRRAQRNTGQLTGTWRLDVSRSDNADDVVERAIRGLPAGEQQKARERLTRRLDAPDVIAIEQRGRRFTIASSRAPKATFDADGRTRTETTERGRTVRVNASLNGGQLMVNRTGSQGSDYNVTFDPAERGQRMRITRSIYAERFPQPIVVASVYEKTSDIAQLNIYTGPRDNAGAVRPANGRFIVPNNTRLTAVLTTNLTTKADGATNRFSMEVRSPAQYRGAVIEGIVSNIESSGRVTGSAELTLNFDRIRLRDGSTYEFRGTLESIRTPDGKEVKLESEGTIKDDDSQTKRTVTRSGIGAALGAVIGAIAGGGSGAAIGAAVGAGAGAGTVLIQGRDNLDLPSGTEITVRSSSPRNNAASR